MTISSLDVRILGIYVTATVIFGLLIGRGQKTSQDYLLGGRDLPWWALLVSIVATETSTATFLSVPGIAYGGFPGTTGDLRFLQLPLGYLLGRLVAARFLLPLYFEGQLYTAYDVLRTRSGPAVRTLASGLFLVTRTLADGLRLYLAAVVLALMLGGDMEWSVLALGVGTLGYTLVGGIRAVVWTDVIQFVVYMIGAGAALLVLSAKVPQGLGGVVEQAQAAGRLRVFDFGLDLSSPYTLWAGLIGGAVLSIGSHGTDQLIVQRYLSARSLRDAQRALLWSGPLVLVQFALFLLLGLGLSSFYQLHPPADPFPDSDHVFAHFVVHNLPVGLVGIVLGAVFAAAMSTLSSSLSASASALVNDFALPLLGKTQDDPVALRLGRLATVLFAGLQVWVGISGLGGGAIVGRVLGIAGVTTGVILGLFLLVLRGRTDPRASLIGLLTGLVAIWFVVFGLPQLGWSLAWPWHGLITCGATFLGGRVARIVRAAA